MIVKEEFLKKLKAAFDLNIYEVKIWTALLSRGMAAAGELSDISQVPRSRSYDVLESLEKKGFVMMKLGRPIKYIAVKPEDIVKRLKTHLHEKTEARVTFLDNIKEDVIFSDLELLYKQGVKKTDPYSLSGSLKGRDAIYAHLRTIMESAEKEVILVTSEAGAQRKARRFKSLLNKIKEKGVAIKVAAPFNTLEGPLKDVKKTAQFRQLQKLNARFCIVDGEQIVFMVCNDNDVHENYDTAIWVKSPFFCQAFHNMFKNTWNELKPVK